MATKVDEESVRSRSHDREGSVQLDYEENNTCEEDQNGEIEEDDRSSRRGQQQHADHADNENFNLYITNLAFETTDEALRAAFEPFGVVEQASVIKQPVTKISRGFAFVSMSTTEESQRALDAMNGFELNGRAMRAEKARRQTGYSKTPGVYMGPAKLSAKYVSAPAGSRDRSRSRGRDYRDNGSGRERGRSYERDRRDSRAGGRDSRDYERERYYRMERGGPPAPYPMPYDMPPRYRDDRYPPDPRFDMRARYDMRDVRRGPPAYPDARASPPRYDPRRGRSPPPFDSRGFIPPPAGYYRGPPPRY